MNEKEAMMRYMEQQAGEVQARIEQLLAAVMENETVINALPEIKKGAESFSALGSGVFVKTKISDDSRVLLNLGADVLAEYSVKDTEERLKKIQENLKQDLEKLNAVMTKIKADYARIASQ